MKLDFIKSASNADESVCVEWPFTRDRSGYGWFQLLGEKRAHRVAYRVFYGDFDKELHVLHKCDNPACINPKHLFLGTHQENMRDKAAKTRAPRDTTKHIDNRGSLHGNSILTEFSVAQIRADYDSGKATQSELARQYGVSRQAISDVVRRVRWTHV